MIEERRFCGAASAFLIDKRSLIVYNINIMCKYFDWTVIL